MKKCIYFNTKKRMNSANDFKKYFFKLMVNSVYGKQWRIYEKESVRVTNEKDFLKYTSTPTHITHKTFDKDFAWNY